jgi:hypothetical protein
MKGTSPSPTERTGVPIGHSISIACHVPYKNNNNSNKNKQTVFNNQHNTNIIKLLILIYFLKTLTLILTMTRKIVINNYGNNNYI